MRRRLWRLDRPTTSEERVAGDQLARAETRLGALDTMLAAIPPPNAAFAERVRAVRREMQALLAQPDGRLLRGIEAWPDVSDHATEQIRRALDAAEAILEAADDLVAAVPMLERNAAHHGELTQKYERRLPELWAGLVSEGDTARRLRLATGTGAARKVEADLREIETTLAMHARGLADLARTLQAATTRAQLPIETVGDVTDDEARVAQLVARVRAASNASIETSRTSLRAAGAQHRAQHAEAGTSIPVGHDRGTLYADLVTLLARRADTAPQRAVAPNRD